MPHMFSRFNKNKGARVIDSWFRSCVLLLSTSKSFFHLNVYTHLYDGKLVLTLCSQGYE